jgi:TonB family protein
MIRTVAATLLVAMSCGRAAAPHEPRSLAATPAPPPPPTPSDFPGKPPFEHPLYRFPTAPREYEPLRNPSPPPVRIAGDVPRYPEAARRARVSGVVVLELLIERDGHVSQVHVLKPLPLGLDAAAADAAKTWRYKPVMWNGKPVRVIWLVTVPFTAPA